MRKSRLVLRLKLDGDPIVVADELSVKLVEVRHRTAKLLFEAPLDVRIDRFTVWLDRRAGVKPKRRTP